MIGQTLDGRYRVLRSLGAGGFGQTYVAEDTRRPGHPPCVVKVLQPASSDPEFLAVARRLFRSEAETLEKLGHHDHIPRLLAFFEQDQDFFLVQEFIDGIPLTDELMPGEQWSELKVRSLLSEVLDILAFIHEQGVIHRDIKPENILRRRADQKLVLVDFGSVKQVRNQALVTNPPTNITVVVGTPGYMASEQSQGKPRPNSDLYSLGIIGIQALTGRPPSQFREDGDGELIWRDQAEVSDGFAQVLTQLVRPYFKLRYQTAKDALQALQRISLPPGIAPISPPPSPLTANTPAPEPTQVVASPVSVESPRQRLQPQPLHKSSGCAPWVLGFGIMTILMGLGLAGLSYWGVTDDLLPFLQPKEVTVDNGENLLAQAQQEAQQTGNLEAAIAIAQQVPTNSSRAEAAQTQVQQWQAQWQQQQNLFRRAKAAFDAQQWYAARDLAFKLPQNPYWDRQADPIYFTAKRKIAELERPSPKPTPTPTEAPEPTLEPSPSPNPTPADEPTISPSPNAPPLGSPVEIPVPTPANPNPNEGSS
ncbi:serine/threonine-protein kinase [Acaryochloris sp. IP29b_bin.137]|uniref:serine/threonine-protein kinase n=1 Tax=Acaryochloris sp. IP29b_bin.137 TaxID=2969217 RepID=UPI0026228778|nr:serine/threonine-protein kinase [Acaryochloris sp. IP29b_bin.137]